MESTTSGTIGSPDADEGTSTSGGDTIVCLAGSADQRLDGSPVAARVAAVAPLDSRSDIEDLLRRLAARPQLRHLVLAGSDPRSIATALVRLWKDGIDTDGGIGGPQGALRLDLDAAVLESLREDISITDIRGEPLDSVIAAIDGLAVHAPPRRTSQIIPAPSTPQRRVFLSRKTSFPIFSSDAGDSWLQLLNLALRIGTEKQTESGDVIAEALNAMVTIDAPLLEDGEAAPPPEFPTFFDFAEQDFDERFDPHYRSRFAQLGGDIQLAAICERLEASPDTASGTVVFRPTAQTESEEPFELISMTLTVVDQRLLATFDVRECDIYTDWPLLAAALLRLQREAAGRTGVEAGTATFVIHRAVLAARDFRRSQSVLDENFRRPLPLHVDPSGVFLFGSDASGARGMLLNHDASEILWEDAFEDPEDLSWYIVDVMPWLLPQHIRYVGQECASLMRAIQAGECYLQG